MKLENWSVVCNSKGFASLYGNVYGHPNFEDGEIVTTSYIVNVKDDKVYTYSGSIYELGEVDPKYEKVFPNARERLFANKFV